MDPSYVEKLKEVQKGIIEAAPIRFPVAEENTTLQTGEFTGWKSFEIPSHLQPTLFVMKPGKVTPTMNYLRVMRTEDKILVCMELRTEMNDLQVQLVRHLSKINLTGTGPDWTSFMCNAVVIGWENEKLRPAFLDFIKNSC